jgi:hypothetical protein
MNTELTIDAILEEKINAICEQRISSHKKELMENVLLDIEKMIASKIKNVTDRLFPCIDEHIKEQQINIIKEIHAVDLEVKQHDLKMRALYDSIVQTTRCVANIESNLRQEYVALNRIVIQQDEEHSTMHEILSNKLELQRIDMEVLHKKMHHLRKRVKKCKPKKRETKEVLSDTESETTEKSTPVQHQDWYNNMLGEDIQEIDETEVLTKETDFSKYIRNYEKKYCTKNKNNEITDFIEYLKDYCYQISIYDGSFTIDETIMIEVAIDIIEKEYAENKLILEKCDNTLIDAIERRLIELTSEVGIKFKNERNSVDL